MKCFGEGGWTERYTVIEAHPDARMIVVKCDFAVPKLKIFRQAFGGNANEDRGDAFKGACTDALTKCASKLGIANQVFQRRVRRAGKARSQSRARLHLRKTDSLTAPHYCFSNQAIPDRGSRNQKDRSGSKQPISAGLGLAMSPKCSVGNSMKRSAGAGNPPTWKRA